MSVLLTSRAGCIGSHAAVELVVAGYGVAVLHDFSNNTDKATLRVGRLAGDTVSVVCTDVREQRVWSRPCCGCARLIFLFILKKAVVGRVAAPVFRQQRGRTPLHHSVLCGQQWCAQAGFQIARGRLCRASLGVAWPRGLLRRCPRL